MNRYLPLSEYGLIGNCHTAALVSSHGSIDWLCSPRFDSPSLFGRILDARSGGCFRIRPAADYSSEVDYVPDTGILRITYRTPAGTATLADFMPLGRGERSLPWGKPRATPRLVRLIEGVEGNVELTTHFEPATWLCSIMAVAFSCRGRGVDRARGGGRHRVGNAASVQFQLNGYGDLLNAFHIYRRAGRLSKLECSHLWPAFVAR